MNNNCYYFDTKELEECMEDLNHIINYDCLELIYFKMN